jgi:ribonuclease-3
MHNEAIQDLEVLLGHSFRDKNFLINALSHSSIKSEDRPSNERMEFLGDSVLGLIISDALYRRYPEDDEGNLTRIKSQAVSRSTLQRIAVAMGLDRHILVGKGVAKREIPASLLGNLFEAIVGAIYLDAGLAAARKFILRHLDVIIGEIVQDRAERNYKSMLQHHCQREMNTVPGYRVLREAGPAHHRTFDVAVTLNGREFGRARGDSKKEAEQGSARAALLHFRAIQESPNQDVRGAGSILRIGPDEGGRRGRPPEPQGGAPEAVGEAPPQGERRGRRSRRRRRGGGGGGGERPPFVPAPQAAEPAPAAPEAPSPPAEPMVAEPQPPPPPAEGAPVSPDAPPPQGRRRRSSRRRGRRGRGGRQNPPPPTGASAQEQP